MGASSEKNIKNQDNIKEGDLSASKNSKAQDISENIKDPELFNKIC